MRELLNDANIFGAGGEIRTLMPLRALRPEHSVSTNSTTSAIRVAKLTGICKNENRLLEVGNRSQEPGIRKGMSIE